MTTTAKWSRLPRRVRRDLRAWFNYRPDAEDKQRLAELYEAGRFKAWNCPDCGTRVYQGDPEDWSHFQGVRQVDYISYPGRPEVFSRRHIRRQCDHCRCYNNAGTYRQL